MAHVRSFEREERVTPLELFFDLVFVFAITQVTGFLADELDREGLLRGALLLAALWWAWAAYAWLTNTLDPEEGGVRLAMFGSIGRHADRVARGAHAFGATASSSGSRTSVVRVLHIVLYVIAGRAIRSCSRPSSGTLPAPCSGPALLVVAGFLDGTAQLALWIAALAIDYLDALVGRRAGLAHLARTLRRAPRADHHHRAGRVDRRHRRRRGGLPLDAATITAALLGVVIAACAVVVVLRLGRLRRRRPGWPKRRAPNASRWRATCTPTSTCRWSSGSSCSRSA